MKMKFTLLILIILMGSGFKLIEAQTLIVRTTDGNEVSQLLSDVQKLSFSSGELLVTFKAGTLDNYNLADIQKLYFFSGTSVDEIQNSSDEKLLVYPNPATEILNIANIPDESGLLQVYSFYGQLILEKQIMSEKMTLDVSSLPAGMYFIKTNSSNSKFIKQ